MKLLEYEAKQILKAFNIPVSTSSLITKGTSQFPATAIVLKSQVPTGGRGKAGGIKVVESIEDLQPTIDQLFKLAIKGFTPQTLLAEEKLSIAKELYISILIDRATSSIQLIAHIDGGVEVEDNKDFKTWPLSDPDFDVIGQELADYYQLPDHTFAIQDLIENLYNCFIKNDATLLEINPLVLTTDNKLIAGDCKMTLDDAASFRHEWSFEDTPAEANFVTINPDGNIATIANGAGLAMATVDASVEAGLHPANFLDIGGGASTETLLAAFNRIVEYENLQAIVINIFAGITRADEVANAIVAAKEQIATLPPLFIRLAGTNHEAAVKILNDNGIVIMPNLEACLNAAKEAING
jgi:succinyl-CoA synthetase beta subunit